MQETTLMGIGWIVLGTYRVIGTQFTKFQSIAKMFMNPATDLDQPAQRALRV